MIVSKIIGGLGNQMFQYAIGHALAQKNRCELQLDISAFDIYALRNFELGDVFGLSQIAEDKLIQSFGVPKSGTLDKIFKALFGDAKSLCYQERFFTYDPNVNSLKPPCYLEGYWQSEKYFLQVEKSLRQCFSFVHPLSPSSSAYAAEISKCESVSLHIRRGDYVTDAKTNSFHGVLSLDYYRKAVKELSHVSPNLHYFVFSDDIEWAKNHVGFVSNVTFVEQGDDAADWEEMCLMTICKHNIIANSSFSWWGAWLNANPDKIVIAPETWFGDPAVSTADLIPESWIRV